MAFLVSAKILLAAIPSAFQALGAVLGGLLMNRIGRRWTNFTMNAFAIMAAIVMVTSLNRTQLMAARCINYMYYGAGVVVNSAYIAELVPPQIRGIAVGAFYVSFTFAALVMSGVLVGTATIASNLSWQIPVSKAFSPWTWVDSSSDNSLVPDAHHLLLFDILAGRIAQIFTYERS